MYFVKRIIIDDKSSYVSSQIVTHTNKTISLAKTLLEDTVKDYVREEKGREAADSMKILDIHDISQVNEPLIDGILLYRLETDPHKILVYQRKSNIEQSKTWTGYIVETLVSKFRQTDVFELEEYGGFKLEFSAQKAEIKTSPLPRKNCDTEMFEVNQGGPKVPVPVGGASKGNLLDDLKNSDKFKHLKRKANEAVSLSSEQFKEQDVQQAQF